MMEYLIYLSQVHAAPIALPNYIGKRYPWWKNLVASAHEKEKETLCPT